MFFDVLFLLDKGCFCFLKFFIRNVRLILFETEGEGKGNWMIW